VLALAFPPAALWPIAFVALIPFLWAVRESRPRRGFLLGFVFGFAYFGAQVYWILLFGELAWSGLTSANALYTAVFGLFAPVVWRRERPVRSVVGLAALWTAFEFARGSWPLGGLTWGGLLQTQVNGLKEDNDRFAVLYDELGRRGETVDVLQKALTEAAFRQEHLQNLLQEQDQAMRVVALGGEGQEDLVGTPASEARGRYMWSREEGLGVLFLSNLPQLPEDSTYQLWVTREGGSPVSGGTFTPQADGSARLIVRTGDLAGTLTGMAITVEPADGSTTPTGDIVLQGQR